MAPAETEDPGRPPTPLADPEPEPETENSFTTEPNGFGLYRQYTRKPHSDPEDFLMLDDLVDDNIPELELERHRSETAPIGEVPHSVTTTGPFHPFSSLTVFRYIKWSLGVSRLLSVDLDLLVHEVILSEDFNREDFRNFSAARELARLDQYGSNDLPFDADDGWKVGSVTINVPNAKHRYASESDCPGFCVTGIYYHSLIEIIKAACQGPQASKYHWIPFKLFHQSSPGSQHVYTDIYNSDAMLEEDAKIKSLQRELEDEPDVEATILGILLWSDSTHLAMFGMASLWPIYVYIGNLLKYAHGQPNTCAAHHMAYIPSVSLEHGDLLDRDCLPPTSSRTPSRTSI
jgi:hypothetical protein